MLSLPALIPGVGPWLAAALGGAGTVAKSAASALAPILGNPFVQGALAVAILFLGWQWEEGRVSKAVAAGQAAIAVEHGAFVQERASFATILGALADQNRAVHAMATAGARKTALSTKIARAAPIIMAKAQAQASAIAAADQGVTGCAAAQATYQATRKDLR